MFSFLSKFTRGKTVYGFKSRPSQSRYVIGHFKDNTQMIDEEYIKELLRVKVGGGLHHREGQVKAPPFEYALKIDNFHSILFS